MYCMFIDQGFMRRNEGEKINEVFTRKFKIKNFIHVDASERFFGKLQGLLILNRKGN